MRSKSTLYRFVGITGLVVYGWVCFNFVRLFIKGSTAPEVCLLKSTTGVPCPFCGTTRSIMSAVQGEWLEAVLLNPLGLALLLFVVVAPLWMLVDYLSGTESFYRTYTVSVECIGFKALLIIGVVIVLSLWLFQLLKP